ncbi:MAG: glycoside hydrolase family 127 protein [Armatimonadetes bacterium]|nr:glycoside hydrolase family 127 protein [Armatimonadota bacterium]
MKQADDGKIDDSFWSPRLRTNHETTIWAGFNRCEETGRIDNFAIAGGLKEGEFKGICYDDSDVYKMIEGASYVLAASQDKTLDKYLDELIAKIASAQEEDGYLYTIRTIQGEDVRGAAGRKRWSNLAHSHELYNVGHLYEAAVAHHRATGKESLLDVAAKSADLIVKTFGLEEGMNRAVPGHEEIEIGLIKLSRATGKEEYFALAKHFIDMRGQSNLRSVYGDYCQDGKPFTEQRDPVGHAVRAMYLYTAAADVAAINGDREYIETVDALWQEIVSTRMAVTGGIGARRSVEGFSEPYDLPNASAYNETCAAIGFGLWNQRMFVLHRDGKYVDVLERILYNGFLSGVSLSGDTFFYPNPLASDGIDPFNHGSANRKEWFETSCCPVNIVRYMPSIAGMIYAADEKGVSVNLFIGSDANLVFRDLRVRVGQRTEYPWSGRIELSVDPEKEGEFELRIRVPGWANGRPVPSDLYRYLSPAPASDSWSVSVNGESNNAPIELGFAVVRRVWKKGDEVVIEFPMDVQRVVAHEEVEEDKGLVCLERGPIVYCFEGADNPQAMDGLVVPDDARIRTTHKPDLLGGVTVLETLGDPLLTAIPYFAWSNRGTNPMRVWVGRR